MNRLIIIGNGFDLAHGLKTSYCDFISDYLGTIAEKVSRDGKYKDLLVDQSISKIHKVSEFLAACIQRSRDIGWVDLESLYFRHLLKCKSPVKGYDFQKVAELNAEWNYVTTLLEEYLRKVQDGIAKPMFNPKLKQIFGETINPKDVVLEKLYSSNPRNTMFLNFNYTNTLNQYVAERTSVNPLSGTRVYNKDVINHIHGEVDNKLNPIIFGFGDEHDEDYKHFEKLDDNIVFEHIKSFAYLKTNRYHDLVRFINDDKFQVYIIGHSCGLSDRTMFRQIFENPNCYSIKIFYHLRKDGSNDFTKKTYDLSRHFTDKIRMRNLIVPFERSEPVPQMD